LLSLPIRFSLVIFSNFANFVVLFVAPHPARKQAMMNLLEKLTHGTGQQHLLAAFGFQVFPTIL